MVWFFNVHPFFFNCGYSFGEERDQTPCHGVNRGGVGGGVVGDDGGGEARGDVVRGGVAMAICPVYCAATSAGDDLFRGEGTSSSPAHTVVCVVLCDEIMLSDCEWYATQRNSELK